jgi:hypothetical protein
VDPVIGDILYTLLLGLTEVAVAVGVRLAPGIIGVEVGVGVGVAVDVGVKLPTTDGVGVAGVGRVAVGVIGVAVGPLAPTLKLHQSPPFANRASLGFTATTSQ